MRRGIKAAEQGIDDERIILGLQPETEEGKSFSEEKDNTGQHVKKSSSIVKLKPMLGENGLLRFSGRISEAPSTFDKRELGEALERSNQNQIEEHLKQTGVEWIFHPPLASYMSGVWERLIRGVKQSLKAILGKTLVKEEDLRTVPAITLPPGKFDDADLYSRKSWRQSQIMSDHFWKRWLHEYLPTLQQRQKWATPQRNLAEAVGDLVLLVDENLQRGHWPLGRVTKVFPGKDGLVRIAEVKTKNVLKRPIQKLCFLEVDD
ncbi:Hypothetical predicted protein [Paramuricea clavata]|uniref:Uncharacterized protein n=1 Tax=Paramuricea clavata TaxID=317549 RepID=A0A7D9DSY3_PARCT|nr:Hypothetical predicted protein [Paramuricea clavata]